MSRLGVRLRDHAPATKLVNPNRKESIMYQKAAAGFGVAGAGVLPFTGSNIVYIILAAFALIAAGAAILRVIPAVKTRKH